MRRRLTERLSVPGLRFSDGLPLPAKIALVFIGVVALAALLAPVIASYSPLATGAPATAPDGQNWFGTDGNGRDIFSRVLYGARYSLMIGIGATLVALAAAAVLGSIAATAGKVVSEVLMRIMDIIMSFPGIALAAVFVAVFGNSVTILILTIAFLYTPQLTRVVRANVLAQFGEDYVSATRVMGARTPWIPATCASATSATAASPGTSVPSSSTAPTSTCTPPAASTTSSGSTAVASATSA